MVTFWEIAAPSVYHLFSLYLVYLLFLLFPMFCFEDRILVLIVPVPGQGLFFVNIVISHFGFEGGVWVLLVSVPSLCLPYTFYCRLALCET